MGQYGTDYWGGSTASSADGKVIVFLGSEGDIRCYDGFQARRWPFHIQEQATASYPVISADASALAFLSQGNTIQVYSRSTGVLLSSIAVSLGREDHLSGLAISTEGTRIAGTVTRPRQGDSIVRIWDVLNGQILREVRFPRVLVSSLTFVSCGRVLTIATGQGSINFYDVDKGTFQDDITSEPSPVVALAVTRDRKYLASAANNTISLWSLPDRKLIRKLAGHSDAILTLDFSPDGLLLASGGRDRTIRLWMIPDGQERCLSPGHHGPVHAVCMLPSHSLIASAGQDGTLRIWNWQTRLQVSQLVTSDHPLTSIACSSDGKMIAAGEESGIIYLLNRVTNEITPLSSTEEDGGRGCVFSLDGSVLFSIQTGSSRDISVWDTGNKKVIERLRPKNARDTWSIAISPDGNYLSSSHDNVAMVWNASTRQIVQEFRMDGQRCLFSMLSADNRQIASIDTSGWVQLWDRATEHLIIKFFASGFYPFAFSLSPDARMVAVGTYDGRVQIIETRTGQLRREFHRHIGKVRTLAFSPDGRYLASGSDDTTVLLWDLYCCSLDSEMNRLSVTDAWNYLQQSEAGQAYSGLCRLVSTPTCLESLAGRIRLDSPPTGPEIRDILSGLDSDEFSVRAQSRIQLNRWGTIAIPTLVEILQRKLPLETRKSVEIALERLRAGVVPPQELRLLRAIEVLERLQSPQALQLLESLAQGSEHAVACRESQATLSRLHQRQTMTKESCESGKKQREESKGSDPILKPLKR
jgi:WD40 repeat protein